MSEGNTRGNTSNLQPMPPWEVGKSGNPAGRPIGSKDGLEAKVRRLLRKRAPDEVMKILRSYGYEPDEPTYADALAIVTVHQGLQGEIPAIKLLKEMDEDSQAGGIGKGQTINIQVNAVPSKEKSEGHEVTINGIPVKETRNNGNNG